VCVCSWLTHISCTPISVRAFVLLPLLCLLIWLLPNSSVSSTRCAFVCVCVCVCSCTNIYVCTQLCVYVCVCVSAYVCVCACNVCVRLYVLAPMLCFCEMKDTDTESASTYGSRVHITREPANDRGAAADAKVETHPSLLASDGNDETSAVDTTEEADMADRRLPELVSSTGQETSESDKFTPKKDVGRACVCCVCDVCARAHECVCESVWAPLTACFCFWATSDGTASLSSPRLPRLSHPLPRHHRSHRQLHLRTARHRTMMLTR
jgi:hypothetical protein